MKTCTGCGEEKALEEFGVDRRNKDGKRQPCKECARIANRAYSQTPEARELARLGMAAWRARNPERNRAARKRHYQNTREQRLEDMRRYRNTHKKKMAALDKAWREKNRHVKAEIQRQRNARLRNQFVAEVVEQEIILRDQGRCGLCGEPIMGPFHIEHIHPVSRGGTHEPDNVQLAHPACNWRKGAKVDFVLSEVA